MRNCKFCFKPVPDECGMILRGRLNGKKFNVVDDEAEFMCPECEQVLEECQYEPNGLEIGGIEVVKDE